MNEIKITLIMLVQTLISVFKTNITRWIIRTYFSTGEIPITRWFTWAFISTINIPKILGLLVIASFTLITFPLGIWIASFSVGQSYPVNRFIGGITNLVSFPVNFYIMSQTLREMPVNRLTIIGGALHELAFGVLLVSSWFLWKGANQ